MRLVNGLSNTVILQSDEERSIYNKIFLCRKGGCIKYRNWDIVRGLQGVYKCYLQGVFKGSSFGVSGVMALLYGCK